MLARTQQLGGFLQGLLWASSCLILMCLSCKDELNGFLQLYKTFSIYVYFPEPQCYGYH